MCKHKRIHLNEYGTSYTYHDREEDGIWTHFNDFGDYTGAIHAKCDECGLNRLYYKNNLPKWLSKYIDEIEAQDKF